jgi:hypothetical protein
VRLVNVPIMARRDKAGRLISHAGGANSAHVVPGIRYASGGPLFRATWIGPGITTNWATLHRASAVLGGIVSIRRRVRFS